MVVAETNKGFIPSEAKTVFYILRRRRTKVFLYGFMLTFMACTAYIAFCPSGFGSPWFNDFFATATASTAPYRSQFSSFFSRFFPDSTVESREPTQASVGSPKGGNFNGNLTKSVVGSPQSGVFSKNQTKSGVASPQSGVFPKNHTKSGVGSPQSGVFPKNQTKSGVGSPQSSVLAKNNSSSGILSKQSGVLEKKQTRTRSGSGESGVPKQNQTTGIGSPRSGVLPNNNNQTRGGETPTASAGVLGRNRISNFSASLEKSNGPQASSTGDHRNKNWSMESMKNCDIFHGHWVKDDSYPLYPHGSCPHIDEPFNCYLNGRPDTSYQKLRWQPSGCNIPRLNATDMLERLRGKRLVFVGDSLNRNMWESLVCILKNSVKDKKKVFEASGRHEFRTEGSYSFLFKDYGCTVEFFRSPFLVQEWEMPDTNGSKKETLRLDVIERSSSKYKDADVIVFNTGHWWTHEKTSKGKDYYQEGNKIYNELNVVEAFHKALNTWSKWIDVNINRKKTLVFFRGYSASHFSGGRWNSGGQCDSETEPIENEKYLSSYPPKMSVLESVLKGMKTPVSYLNITRMTDYRKDGHPSIYRKAKLTEAERRSPDRYQDCSHWCLPGVPDSWNELLYAQLLIKQHQAKRA